MNCKPGDLAMYVGMHREFRGAVVKVVVEATLSQEEKRRAVDDTHWRIDPPLGGNFKCADCALRPLSDPGEDARDETLIWKSVPSSSKEHA